MIVAPILLFVLLLFCSAFFSSAETALLSISRVKLLHKAKKSKRARVLSEILEKPEEFFSTILIGNNLVNVAVATLATYLFTTFFHSNKSIILILETFITTIILLVFAEITPKTYAFRHAEQISLFYTYPLRATSIILFPFVKLMSLVSTLLIRKKKDPALKDFSIEEIKHFLSHETQLFQYSPDTLLMIYEIIEISRKDIRSIMTPRPNIVALEENSDFSELKKIILGKKISRIPIYRERLDNITGIIQFKSLISTLLSGAPVTPSLKQMASPPFFVSEYSSLHYILSEFKKNKIQIAIVLDEYGATIGLITLSDILRETIGDLDWRKSHSIRKLRHNVYIIKGTLPVEEINSRMEWDLPQKKDYSTLSGLFIYHYGRLPVEKSRLHLGRYLLIVRLMGKRRIEEITLIINEDHHS